MEVNLTIVVLGDLNENLLNNNNTNLKNIILFNNLDNVIKEPTRITATSTTLIDPILVSNSFDNYKAGYLDLGTSDLFNELVASENWDFLNTSTVDVACAYFTNKIHDFMNLCIPSKVVTIRPNDKPWYDSEIRRFSKYRDSQRRISLVSNSPSS